MSTLKCYLRRPSHGQEKQRSSSFISDIEKLENSTKIEYSFLNFYYSFEIPFIDDASIENAINCLAIALYLHVSPNEISERMSTLEPVAMRLDVRKGKHGSLIINDSYNSDVNSIKIALDFQHQRKMDRKLKKLLSCQIFFSRVFHQSDFIKELLTWQSRVG